MADGWLNEPFDLYGRKIWVAGERGMVGSALIRRLESENSILISSEDDAPDLRVQGDVASWMQGVRPDVVVIAAAKVGGILANRDYPADFLYDNIMMAANIIHGAHQAGVKKLLFLGSSCIYPKDAPLPITEDSLLCGSLEPSNEAYAMAKIAGIKLCQAYRRQHGRDFISVMPCNLYGPGDRFEARTSHVIPALLLKAHAAKLAGAPEFEVWGSGTPQREFLYVEDLADALVFALKHYADAQPLNIGAGKEISIGDLAALVAEVTGFKGRIIFDGSKPDGVPRKLMDSSRINQAGWAAQTKLREGLARTYEWYCAQPSLARAA